MAPGTVRRFGVSYKKRRPNASTFLSELLSQRWLTCKGPKTAPSRWFNNYDMNEYYLPFASEKLLVLIFLGLSQGASWGKGGGPILRNRGTNNHPRNISGPASCVVGVVSANLAEFPPPAHPLQVG